MVFSRLWRSSDPITLPTEYMDFLNLCLNSTNFQYYSKLYQQLHGTVVRSPVSFAVAEIVMQNIEERAFSTCRQSIPLPLRYVDETPPQDTTKSTHSTITNEKNTDTQQFIRGHDLNGGLHVKHLEYLCSMRFFYGQNIEHGYINVFGSGCFGHRKVS